MESDNTRQLSSFIFQEIKPYCQKVSELAQGPFSADSDTLTHALRQVSVVLATHLDRGQPAAEDPQQTHSHTESIISTRLADYIFFPLSNLLKNPQLSDAVVTSILEILARLVKHAWSHDIDAKLLDQLFPLAIFLAAGERLQQRRVSVVSGKPRPFNLAASACLGALVRCVPRDYYQHNENMEKRLSLLGDTTTILLDVLDTLDATAGEAAAEILRALAWLYATRVSPEQASFVFPGIVSKVINFHSKTKNLSSGCLLAILDVLKALIVKVFGDRGLEISITDESAFPPDLSTLTSLMEHSDTPSNADPVPVRVILSNAEGTHRSTAWLEATSKQLKLSLLIFMKNLILSSGSRTRLVSNHKLADGIFAFMTEIVRTCFKALFREVLPSTLDILSALFYVLTQDQPDSVEMSLFVKINAVYTILPRSDLQLLYKQVCAKTGNLITAQLPQILSSSSEDKICLCVSALKVHLHVLTCLSQALTKSPDAVTELSMSVLETLAANISQNVGRENHQPKSGAGRQALLDFLGGHAPQEPSQNTLDEIELPPHIDAKKLGSMTTKRESLIPVSHTNVARRIDLDLSSSEPVPQLFANTYSKTSERMIRSLARFLGDHCGANTESVMVSLGDVANAQNEKLSSLTSRCVSLWLSNALYRSAPNPTDPEGAFDIDEFLDFDDEEGSSTRDTQEETSYLLLQTAQGMVDDIKAILENSELDTRSSEYKMCENAYMVALETIGLLASRLSKEDFQADVLMDYLYPLLEALTYTPDSQVFLQAKTSLSQIVDVHYDGSLENLVKDNADYLVDSLSMNLSVASGLTPALPGILLVVIRISGVQLLLSNQLQDILSEIFIVVDSFHGYSALVENFFHVFEEIVLKVKEIYGKEISDVTKVGTVHSPYKPWGISDRADMVRLIDDANRLVDPFSDYDPEKEYFHRKPGVPFSEQEGDSDDEDEDNEPAETQGTDQPEPWPSPVPKNIYTSVQQLFTYGLQLLSHPSVKLRIQILRTLKEAYPIMSSNYKALMPLLAQYWPLLLVMSTGTTSLSEVVEEKQQPQTDQLIVPTLEFMIVIFDEDKKHEKFMSSRFVDMWEFMKKKAAVISKALKLGDSVAKRAMVHQTPVSKTNALYSSIYIRGINTYEKSVPDLVVHDMVRVCRKLGIDKKEELGKDVRNHLWVLSQMPVG
ncbi:hypothetical protein JCM33374_g2459 [Metschnikowia sp. JCM 33374]|nr:hypothetical protein JCM33374_g2459 [Metschnikowia sp. JCM 33374]